MGRKMENRSYRYGINRPRPRYGQKYTKCKMCLIIIMVIGIRQYLSNTWSSIHEKLSNAEAELKKSVAYIKQIVTILIIATFTGAALTWGAY